MDLKKEVEKKYMTVSEYSKKYNKSRQTVHNMIKDGRLGAVEIAGRKFVRILN
tara:strand:- start:723 stop:881 length:159 start_codon:yes stop_codon:yes gene_type:complete